jgi:CubicO group peptidase (beta-lactamase class C family)
LNTFRIAIVAVITVCTSCAPVESRTIASLQPILAALENDEYDDLHSVTVIQNGVLVAEQYYNDGDRQTLLDVRSAGKSVTSLLFGIAHDQRAIESLDDPVVKYWPDAEGSAIGPVRLADILTMRSGLAADGEDPESPGYEDKLDEADDPLAFALAVPGADAPGTRYRYNSLTAYIAGVVIVRATGEGLEDFARDNLFEPLKIERWDWQEDRAGYTKGQGNLFLTAPDFARIGEMVLNGGAYNGQQVVSSEWIEESLKPRFDISDSDPFASGYGYYWYHQVYPVNGRSIEVSFASGNGGNKIYVIPEFDLVVSIMSRACGQGRGQRRSEGILKAILATQRPL